MNDHTCFMQLALEEAQQSLAAGQLPVGAVIVVNDEVWGRGHKQAEANMRLDHAEMIALREALDKNVRIAHEMTLYTTLEPCAMCFGAILNSRIGKLVYALEDPYGGAAQMQPVYFPIRHQVEFPKITSSVLREEAKALFKEFFQTTKDPYWSRHPDNLLVRICQK